MAQCRGRERCRSCSCIWHLQFSAYRRISGTYGIIAFTTVIPIVLNTIRTTLAI